MNADMAPETNRAMLVAQDIARLARSVLGPATKVIWFGSWPQGKAEPCSDVDVAVSTGSAIPPERMAALREAVDALPTLHSVDLLDLNATGPILRKEILQHGHYL